MGGLDRYFLSEFNVETFGNLGGVRRSTSHRRSDNISLEPTTRRLDPQSRSLTHRGIAHAFAVRDQTGTSDQLEHVHLHIRSSVRLLQSRTIIGMAMDSVNAFAC